MWVEKPSGTEVEFWTVKLQPTMPKTDFTGQNLRDRQFVDAELPGAAFAGADVRGVDFSGANLSGADFSGARLGPPPVLAGVLFAAALVVVAGAGWLTGWTLKDILDNLTSAEWERVFGGTLAVIVVVVFLVATVARGLRWALLAVTLVFGAALAVNYVVIAIASGKIDLVDDLRVIALLALLGASMVAGGLARVVGGALSPTAIIVVALTGGLAAGEAGGGVAGIMVSLLLVSLAKRTLKLDPRDRLAADLVARVVAPSSTRFTGADLSGADFTGTTIVHCDTAGANLSGVRWDGGVGPWRRSEG